MATRTVTDAITHTLTITAGTPSSTLRASPQAGVLDHGNPSVYDVKNPLTLFIVQAGIIIIFCRLLHWPLSKLRQPRVIAEVIGGVLLGPSVMGHVPGFTNAIFPTASMPALTMAANLGLVLFLFLVGLEVDLRFLVSNWRIALSVGTLGMILPFGLGVAIAYGLYHQFASEPGTVPVSFGVFCLFIGVAMAITAFPVLCRILTELKLLSTPVGIIVLSAGVGNDVVGWILLALCVALVNAGSGITALYVLLVGVGYTLFLVYGVRPGFMWLLRKTGSLQNGPTQFVMMVTILMVLASAFFTTIIGIHPIFGAFLIGVICPHDGGFAIKVTEKVEDLVSVLLLPLYFALSGLSTNLGLLNNGITWAYVIGVIAIAFVAKVTGGTLAAKASGLVWRESFTIGVLMSCKGLVELIVLNIGLQAKILSTRTFTIFVVMALVTTFATTPIVRSLYPHSYQTKLSAWKRGEIDWAGNKLSGADTDAGAEPKPETKEVRKMLTYLRLDSMSGVMALISLLAPRAAEPPARVHPSRRNDPKSSAEDDSDSETDDAAHPVSPRRPLQVYGVRLTQLTERESSVMRVSEVDEYSARDPVVNAFRTFGQVKNVAIAGQLAIASEANYAATLTERASDAAADLLLLPWSASGAMVEDPGAIPVTGGSARFATGSFSHFVLQTLARAPCTTAVFVDRGFGARQRHGGSDADPLAPAPATLSRTVSALSARSAWTTPATLAVVPRGHHILFPYFGSADDAAALRLVLQMAADPAVTASIVRFELPDPPPRAGHATPALTPVTTTHDDALATDPPKAPKTPTHTTTRTPAPHFAAAFAAAEAGLAPALARRVVFATVDAGAAPVAAVVARAMQELGQSAKGAGDVLVVGRNAGVALGAERGWDGEAGKALGVVAGAVLREVGRASVLVVRAVEE